MSALADAVNRTIEFLQVVAASDETPADIRDEAVEVGVILEEAWEK